MKCGTQLVYNGREHLQTGKISWEREVWVHLCDFRRSWNIITNETKEAIAALVVEDETKKEFQFDPSCHSDAVDDHLSSVVLLITILLIGIIL